MNNYRYMDILSQLVCGYTAKFATKYLSRWFDMFKQPKAYDAENIHHIYQENMQFSLLEFSGTLGRKDFWYLALQQFFMTLLVVILVSILFVALSLPLYLTTILFTTKVVGFWFSICWTVIIFLVLIALAMLSSACVRRMRHAGISPWLALVVLLPYGIGFAILAYFLTRPEKAL